MPSVPGSPPGAHDTGGFRELARRRGDAARAEAAEARRLAKRRQYMYYVPGLITAVAAGVIGTNVLRDSSSTLWTTIGLIASVGVSVGAFLNGHRLAGIHWARHSSLDSIATDYETLAAAVEEPTKQELNELSARREKANLRGTDEPPPPAVSRQPN